MTSKNPKHWQTVKKLLEAAAEPYFPQINDDMDMYYEGALTKAESEKVGEWQSELKSAVLALRQAGPDALPAVRKGLKQVAWLNGRRILLDLVKELGGSDEDKEVLKSILRRAKDDLADDAREVLQQWGTDTTTIKSAVRKPTQSEIEHEL